MLTEVFVKSEYLEIGQIIRININKETGLVTMEQSKKLLWEEGYPQFGALRFEMMHSPLDAVGKLFNEVGIDDLIYGCVINPPENGEVYITFHKDPRVLYNIAKVTIQSRNDLIDSIRARREKEGPKRPKFEFTLFRKRCYCGKILDEDYNKKCPNCTGLICFCGKCHCTEGKNFNNTYLY